MTYIPPASKSTGDGFSATEYNAYLRDNILYLKEHEVPTGAMQQFAGHTAPTGWLLCDGSAISTTTYAALFAQLVKTSTVTITIASPGVITFLAHGLPANAPVKFSTTGALPTGIVAGTTYYVKTVLSANTFTISATPGGTVIATTGSQSGTHTGIFAPFGYTAGASTFTLPDLRGKFPIGAGAGATTRALGDTGGAETATLTTTHLPSHAHSIGSHVHAIHHADASGSSNGAARVTNASDVTTWDTDAAGGTTGSQGSGGAFSILPPWVALNWIVKT